MKRYAKVVMEKVANITKPEGVEIYWAFQTAKPKGSKYGGTICGHYETQKEAEIAAHAYRAGTSAESLVCKQTRKFIK
jgi:hypothetical protein